MGDEIMNASNKERLSSQAMLNFIELHSNPVFKVQETFEVCRALGECDLEVFIDSGKLYYARYMEAASLVPLSHVDLKVCVHEMLTKKMDSIMRTLARQELVNREQAIEYELGQDILNEMLDKDEL